MILTFYQKMNLEMNIEESYMKYTIIPISFHFSLILAACFICECLLLFLKKKTESKIKTFHLSLFYIFISVCCLLFVFHHRELCTLQHLVFDVSTACVCTYCRQRNYSKAQINLSLRDSEGIGAMWAHQTYNAYYERILKNVMERMKNFEEKHSMQFFTKKLLLVIPLSCDIEGTFTQRDPSIEKFGDLEIVEDDAGWNCNRMFKNPVFKISSHKDVYVVAEFAQPVSTLKRSRHLLKEEKFTYIRNCFIKTVKSLLQGSPCILVLHDDENGSETLSSCILSTIEKERQTYVTV